MAFCGNCGTQVNEGVKFCPACGGTVTSGQATPPPLQYQQQPYQQPYQQPVADEAQDAADNKLMGILSYLGILVLVPFLTKKDSPFAQYHAKQGITLCIVWVGYVIVNFLLSLIKITHNANTIWEYKTTPWFVTLITSLLGLAVSVLAIIGIINAVKGLKKPLPLIGGINIIK